MSAFHPFLKFAGLAGCLAIMLAASCTYRPRVLEIQPQTTARSSSNKVKGLKSSMHEASQNGGALRVFLVHGMSNHPYGQKKDFCRFGKQITDYSSLLNAMENKQWLNQKKQKDTFTQAIVEAQFKSLIESTVEQLGFSNSNEECADLEWLYSNDSLIGYTVVRTFTKKDASPDKPKQLVLYINSWAHSCLDVKSKLLSLDSRRPSKIYSR